MHESQKTILILKAAAHLKSLHKWKTGLYNDFCIRLTQEFSSLLMEMDLEVQNNKNELYKCHELSNGMAPSFTWADQNFL